MRWIAVCDDCGKQFRAATVFVLQLQYDKHTHACRVAACEREMTRAADAAQGKLF